MLLCSLGNIIVTILRSLDMDTGTDSLCLVPESKTGTGETEKHRFQPNIENVFIATLAYSMGIS